MTVGEKKEIKKLAKKVNQLTKKKPQQKKKGSQKPKRTKAGSRSAGGKGAKRAPRIVHDAGNGIGVAVRNTVSAKTEKNIAWPNSELATATGIVIGPTTQVGDILLSMPLKVDAYPGTQLEIEMVKWTQWKLRHWDFKFQTTQSKMQTGQIVCFYEPDPDVTYTSGPSLVTEAFLHTTKKPMPVWATTEGDNPVTVRCAPDRADVALRYCLSKSSDDRLTSYGTFYVVYNGGANFTTNTTVFTVAHEQVIDWFKRDLDQALAGGYATPQNEVSATSPPDNGNLLSNATVTAGGLKPTLAEGTLSIPNDQIGSANNLLVTVETGVTNNAGIRLPAQTLGQITGQVIDAIVNEGTVDPETSTTVVTQWLFSPNSPITIYLTSLLAGVVPYTVAYVKGWLTPVPNSVTSLSDKRVLEKYTPKAVCVKHAESGYKLLGQCPKNPKNKMQVGYPPYPVCSVIYKNVSVGAIIASATPSNTYADVTTLIRSSAWDENGLVPTFLGKRGFTSSLVAVMTGLQLNLVAPIAGATLMVRLRFTASDVTKNYTSGTAAGWSGSQAFYPSTATGPGKCELWFVGEAQGGVGTSTITFTLSDDTGQNNATYWPASSQLDVEIYYTQDPSALYKAWKHEVPLKLEGGKLKLNPWKSDASLQLASPVTSTAGSDLFALMLANSTSDGLNATNYQGGSFLALGGPPMPQMPGYVSLFFLVGPGLAGLNTSSVGLGNLGADPDGRQVSVSTMFQGSGAEATYGCVGYTVDLSSGGWHTPTFDISSLTVSGAGSVQLLDFVIWVSSSSDFTLEEHIARGNKLLQDKDPKLVAMAAKHHAEYLASVECDEEEGQFVPIPSAKVKQAVKVRA